MFILAGVSFVAYGAELMSPQQKWADGWCRRTFLGRSHPSCPTGTISWVNIHDRSVAEVSKCLGFSPLPTSQLRGLILARPEGAGKGQKDPMAPCATGVQEVQNIWGVNPCWIRSWKSVCSLGSPRTRPQDLGEEALDSSHTQMLLFPSFPPGAKSLLRCPQAVPCHSRRSKVLSSGFNQTKLCPRFHFSERNLLHPTQNSLLFPTSISAAALECRVSHHPHGQDQQRTHHSWLIQQATESQAGDSRDQHPSGLFCWIKTVQGTVPTGDSRNGAIPVPAPFTGTDKAFLAYP